MKRQWLALAGTILLAIATLRTSAAQERNEPRDLAPEPRDLAPDQPGEEDDLNRELWEFAKKTPYSQLLDYLNQTQRTAQRTVSTGVTLPNGWKLAPAGTQVELGRLPYEAISYAGRVVVLNTGYYGNDPQEVHIVDPDLKKVVKTVRLKSLFPSAGVGLDGDLYLSGGFDQAVYRLNNEFNLVRTYAVKGYTAGLAVVDRQHIAIAYLVTENAQKAYEQGKLAILNTETGAIEREVSVGYFPYAVRVLNGKLYVTLVGENKLRVFDSQLNPLKTLTVGQHPQTMCSDGLQLYVVNTLSDSLSIIDTRQDTLVASINVRHPGFRSGSSPTSCLVQGNRLYVTQAEVNAIALFDKTTRQSLGFIPTGWYPTKVFSEGDQLFTLSAKGIRARRPNPQGPQPFPDKGGNDYVLTLLQGSLSIIPNRQIAPNLTAWTQQVKEGSPLFSPQAGLKLPIRHIFYIVKENRTYDQILGDLKQGNGDPRLALFGQDVTPTIHHLAEQFVLFDNYYANGEISVLGHSFTTSGYANPFLEWLGNTAYSGRYNSYPFGTVPVTFSPAYLWNALEAKGIDYRIYGEPYYLFTRAYQLITETYGVDSELAKRFYAQSMALAAQTDRGRALSEVFKPYYGKATTPANALQLLEIPDFRRALSQVFTGDDSLAIALQQSPSFRQKFATFLYHYPLNYHYYDLGYSDLKRYQDWQVDFQQQVRTGKVAQLHYIWLPNDHTAGTNPKYANPYQLIAQNDAALGKIVQTISQSPIWKDSLILVTEDDAQNGPDHVDATRTVALAIGPYVKRGVVVRDRYDQLSLLRTIEVILGLTPLGLNDALAVPMFSIFTNQPNTAGYTPPTPSRHLTDDDRTLYQQLAR